MKPHLFLAAFLVNVLSHNVSGLPPFALPVGPQDEAVPADADGDSRQINMASLPSLANVAQQAAGYKPPSTGYPSPTPTSTAYQSPTPTTTGYSSPTQSGLSFAPPPNTGYNSPVTNPPTSYSSSTGGSYTAPTQTVYQAPTLPPATPAPTVPVTQGN